MQQSTAGAGPLVGTGAPHGAARKPSVAAGPATSSDSGAFDATARWHLDSQVALRREPFGALAYHYGSRRLTFLRSQLLDELVRALGEYDSVDAALGDLVPERSRPAYRRALASLASSGFIRAS